jgi:hypothetical protein
MSAASFSAVRHLAASRQVFRQLHKDLSLQVLDPRVNFSTSPSEAVCHYPSIVAGRGQAQVVSVSVVQGRRGLCKSEGP